MKINKTIFMWLSENKDLEMIFSQSKSTNPKCNKLNKRVFIR